MREETSVEVISRHLEPVLELHTWHSSQGILAACFENWGLNTHTMHPGNSTASPALSWIQTLLQVPPPILRFVPQNWNNSWGGLPRKICRFKTTEKPLQRSCKPDRGLIWGSWILKWNKGKTELQTSRNRHFQRKWKPVRTRIIMEELIHEMEEEKSYFARQKEMRNSLLSQTS